MKDFEEKEELLEEDFESGGATVTVHRIGRVLKIIFSVIVYSVIAFLVLRVCTDGKEPADVDSLIVTKELAEIYKTNGKLECIYQKYDEYTMEEENYGYFGVTDTVIIPDADQIQIVFRYNNSTLERLPEDYPELCPDVPSRDLVLYDVSLVKIIDTTPDTEEDNKEEGVLVKERYYPEKDLTTSDKTALHSYFRYVFEDIDVSDALEVYVDIYYIEALDYESDPYGSVRIYVNDRYNHTYSLSSKEKRSLKNFSVE